MHEFSDYWADCILSRAGLLPDLRQDMRTLSAGLGLSLDFIHCPSFPRDARLLGTEICVRARLPVADEDYAIAHEVGEWYQRYVLRYRDELTELRADAIARALVCPILPFRAAIRRFHPDRVPELASQFRAREELIVLRYLEVTRHSSLRSAIPGYTAA